MIDELEIEWYKKIMPDLQIIFDVGCHDDNVFYDLNPDLELHLFDPREPEQHLHGTFNQLGLSNTIGHTVYYPEYYSIHYREFKGDKYGHIRHDRITIPITTVDQYCLDNGITKIDLLKIDTEGHDRYVLEGAKRMLPNIRYIQFEHWNNDSTFAIRELLHEYEIDPLGGKPMNYKAKRH